jgi:enamine deaminase RidA (YjgF/YER057c/UK114 family)
MPKRVSTNPPGKPLHRQPIPTATRIGNIIFSSAIGGMDLQSGEIPEDAQTQIANAFINMRLSLEAAGASLEDVGKLTVALRDRGLRETVNRYWLEAFPDEDSRPVRHAVGAPQAPEMAIQLEFIAVADS